MSTMKPRRPRGKNDPALRQKLRDKKKAEHVVKQARFQEIVRTLMEMYPDHRPELEPFLAKQTSYRTNAALASAVKTIRRKLGLLAGLSAKHVGQFRLLPPDVGARYEGLLFGRLRQQRPAGSVQ